MVQQQRRPAKTVIERDISDPGGGLEASDITFDPRRPLVILTA